MKYSNEIELDGILFNLSGYFVEQHGGYEIEDLKITVAGIDITDILKLQTKERLSEILFERFTFWKAS